MNKEDNSKISQLSYTVIVVTRTIKILSAVIPLYIYQITICPGKRNVDVQSLPSPSKVNGQRTDGYKQAN